MSDTAAVTASEVAEAPVEAPVVEAPSTPEAPPAVDRTQQTVSDIKQGAKERLGAKIEAALAEQETQTNAADRMRQPKGTPQGGQFMKEEQAEESPESSTSGDQAPDTLATSASEVAMDGATDTQATTPDVTSVTVPVADNHPLRQRGREAFTVASEDERDIRALLNSHVRRSDLEQASQHVNELSAQLMETRADADYWREQASTGGILSPEQEQTYRDLQNTYGQSDADTYRNGILATSGNEGLQQAKMEARQSYEQSVAIERAHKFANDAINDAMNGNPSTNVPAQYPLWTEPQVRQVLAGYGSICEARNEVPTPGGWYEYANAAYSQNPDVQAHQAVDDAATRKQELAAAEAKVKKEARQQEENNLQQAATRHATRPGSIPSTLAAGVRDHGTPTENNKLRSMSPSQQKRARRSRIRTWGQQA